MASLSPSNQSQQFSDTSQECPICYEPFDSTRKITNCHHAFHDHCIREWLQRQPTCPLCKQSITIITDPLKSEHEQYDEMEYCGLECYSPLTEIKRLFAQIFSLEINSHLE